MKKQIYKKKEIKPEQPQENRPERISYASLEISCSLAVKTILDFKITEKPGEHARGTFHVQIDFDEEKDHIDLSIPFFLWEKDAEGNRKKEPIFAGYPTDVRIDCMDEYREAQITVNSGTVLLDKEKRNRAFQSPDQGILEIADRIIKDTDHAAFILNGPDRDAGGTAIQYQETDWEFLKRLASRGCLPLVADSSYYFPRFYIGMPHGEDRELTEVQDCIYCFHERYYELYGRCFVDKKDFICYDIKTGDRFCIGDHVRYEGRKLVVSEKTMELSGGEVYFRYLITGESYHTVPPLENENFIGMTFFGEVLSTIGQKVQLSLEIDPEGSTGNTYYYAPESGNLMYCMPQKGTRVTLYLGNGREQDGIVTGCIHTSSETCQEMGSPQNKSFRTEHGNGLDLHPGSMGVSGNGGSIRISDKTGTTLESAGDITISAGGKILIEAGEEIKISAMTQIGGMTSSASLCINGNLDFKGENMVLAGRDYKAYEPFNDAPEEGEFDWEGFYNNLALGLLAVGVCALFTAVTIATGGAGIVAATFFSAALGTASATLSGAIGELKSGNVRSLSDTAIDLGRAGAKWAFAGAVGVRFPGMEGFALSGVGACDRFVESLCRNPEMSLLDRLWYALDPLSMVLDYVDGKMLGANIKWLQANYPLVMKSDPQIIRNIDDLSKEQLEALIKYTGDDYVNINNFLRGMETLTPENQTTVEAIRSVLEKSALPQDMTLYRGTSTEALGSLQYLSVDELVGKTFTEQGFMSTSKNKAVAEGFFGNMKMTIKAPKGAHALDISMISQYTTEAEVLFNAGQKMLITSAKVKNGILYITVIIK